MKKIILLLVFMLSILVTDTFAITFNEYGADLINDSFETSLNLNTFPYLLIQSNSGSPSVVTYSEAESKHGKKSILIDLSSIDINDSVIFGHTFANVNADPKNELYYVSFYVKGENISQNDISYLCTYNNSSIATIGKCGFEDADEDGWHKAWYILNYISNYNSSSSCSISLEFTKTSNNLSKIYVDDLSFRTVPYILSMQNREINSSGQFNLDEISGECINKLGERQQIKYKEIIDWSVISDNATIQNRTLYYTPNSLDKIILQADMLGTQCRVTLTPSNISPEIISDNNNLIELGDIINNNGVYSIDITNNGMENSKATLLIALYNQNRLYEVKLYNKTVLPNTKETISSDIIVIPYEVSRPDIKTFIFTS